MHMTREHYKASLKRNQQQSESKTGEHSSRTLAIGRSTDVSEAQPIPAQKECRDNASRYGSCRAQDDLRDMAGKS
jgi:hypothetical protein